MGTSPVEGTDVLRIDTKMAKQRLLNTVVKILWTSFRCLELLGLIPNPPERSLQSYGPLDDVVLRAGNLAPAAWVLGPVGHDAAQDVGELHVGGERKVDSGDLRCFYERLYIVVVFLNVSYNSHNEELFHTSL